jgi:hypothetical protein
MGMRAQGAGDEAKSAGKEDQHDEGVEKTSGAKIDVHVGEHAREDEERTCKSENPARCAPTPKSMGIRVMPKVFAPKKLQKEPTTLT